MIITPFISKTINELKEDYKFGKCIIQDTESKVFDLKTFQRKIDERILYYDTRPDDKYELFVFTELAMLITDDSIDLRKELELLGLYQENLDSVLENIYNTPIAIYGEV